jgi:TonB-dependent starch-binding outer membrane protein SusC
MQLKLRRIPKAMLFSFCLGSVLLQTMPVPIALAGTTPFASKTDVFFFPLHSDSRIVAIEISGKVVDETGMGLPGVNIIEKGSSNGTTTDTNGNYKIQVSGESSILVFSFIGYSTQEIAVRNNTVINVTLNQDVQSLQEVVVVGYGEREKKDIITSVSNVKQEDIAKSMSVAPELALQGRAPGVFVSSPGGAPTARPTVRVRGVGTFNNAEPLYVIDGVPLLEYGSGAQAGSSTDYTRGALNILTLINPGDIESMTVLKDASSAAIYGSRGANGVILITTKKGKSGAPKIDFSASRGVQNLPKKYDVLNTQEYTALYQEMIYNRNEYDRNYAPGGGNPSAPVIWDDPLYNQAFNVYNPNSINPQFPYLGNSATYNWQDAIVNENASIEDYSIRMSGGSDATTYYIGTGYSRTESPLINNDLERYSLNTNVQTKINKYLEAGISYQVSLVDAKDNTSGDMRGASLVSPWQPIYDPNDPTGFAPTVLLEFEDNPDYDPGSSNPGPRRKIVESSLKNTPWGPESNTNYFAQMKLRNNDYRLLRNFWQGYMQVNPFEGFKIRGGISIDYTTNERRQWVNFDEARFSETPNNYYESHEGDAKGNLSVSRIASSNVLKDITFSYAKDFNNHSLDLLLNASDQKFTYKTIGAGTPLDVDNPDNRYLGYGNPRYTGVGEGLEERALQGYVGRVNYDYGDKYYLNASLRYDGSSQFPKDYRWGTFPSVSIGWRVSSEDFFPLKDVFEDLKIRAGYGTAGNTFSGGFDGSRFAYLSTISFNPTTSFGSGNGDGFGINYVGSYLPDFPNFSLTWEKAKTLNVAAEFSLLEGRLSGSVEYYRKDVEGIIQGVRLPYSSGVNSLVAYNIASVRNTGVEILLNYTQKVGEVTLNLGGNLTTVRNRVTSLFNGVDNYNQGLAVGKPIGFIYGFQVGGIYSSEADLTANTVVDKVGNGAPRPGDLYFKDVHGAPEEGSNKAFSEGADGEVSDYDRTFIGKTIPGYFYGFNLEAKWKQFDASLFFQGIGDVQKYNGVRHSGESTAGFGLNLWSTVSERWTPENPSASMPRAIFGDPNQNGRVSDRFVEDASFLRLKNVQIGYTLPGQLLEKARLSKFRIFASGTNLFTVTKWTGIDPENDFVPPTRILSLGVNASF